MQERAPWALFKEDPESAQRVCATAIDAAQVIFSALQPVMPDLVRRLGGILGVDFRQPAVWDHELGDAQLNPFERLADRVERTRLDELVAACVQPA